MTFLVIKVLVTISFSIILASNMSTKKSSARRKLFAEDEDEESASKVIMEFYFGGSPGRQTLFLDVISSYHVEEACKKFNDSVNQKKCLVYKIVRGDLPTLLTELLCFNVATPVLIEISDLLLKKEGDMTQAKAQMKTLEQMRKVFEKDRVFLFDSSDGSVDVVATKLSQTSWIDVDWKDVEFEVKKLIEDVTNNVKSGHVTPKKGFRTLSETWRKIQRDDKLKKLRAERKRELEKKRKHRLMHYKELGQGIKQFNSITQKSEDGDCP